MKNLISGCISKWMIIPVLALLFVSCSKNEDTTPAFQGGLIMVDSAIEYRKELNYAEEVKISVCTKNFNRLGFDIYYLLEVSNGNDFVVAGKVKTGMLCYDYNLKKKVQVPAEALEKMQAYHHDY